jgi:hypothetical protein
MKLGEISVKIKMISGLHLTATNKKHIVDLLNKGWKEGGTKKLWYEILERDGKLVTLMVSTKDSNDWGKVFWRKGKYVIEVSD